MKHNYDIEFARIELFFHHKYFIGVDGTPVYTSNVDHVTLEWQGDSVFTKVDLQNIQHAIDTSAYPVQMPVSHWTLLKPGMFIFIGEFILELMVIDIQYADAICQRIA